MSIDHELTYKRNKSEVSVLDSPEENILINGHKNVFYQLFVFYTLHGFLYEYTMFLIRLSEMCKVMPNIII